MYMYISICLDIAAQSVLSVALSSKDTEEFTVT